MATTRATARRAKFRFRPQINSNEYSWLSASQIRAQDQLSWLIWTGCVVLTCLTDRNAAGVRDQDSHEYVQPARSMTNRSEPSNFRLTPARENIFGRLTYLIKIWSCTLYTECSRCSVSRTMTHHLRLTTRFAYISHTRTHTNIHSKKKKDSRQRLEDSRQSVEKGNQSRQQRHTINVTQNKGNIII